MKNEKINILVALVILVLCCVALSRGFVMLCCVVCVVLCCVVLCCVMLFCVMLYCDVLCCLVLFCFVLVCPALTSGCLVLCLVLRLS
jgi:hypothetical protein